MWQVNRTLFLTAVCLLIVSPGCNDVDTSAENTSAVTADGSAADILRATIERYSQAVSYQDQAILYLTYRLNGRAIQEPHPWSIAWQDSGEFSANWFNARIRCDGQRFSCYVYDIETGNIDNQQILIPADSRNLALRLFGDDIARHFLCGTSELPLDVLETEHQNPLIHPLLCFFDRNFSVAWLQDPVHVQRLGTDQSTGQPCHVLQIDHEQKTYRCWINQESGLIEQIELPLHYLDSEILASEEVTELQFFVRFHDAALNSEIPAGRFEVKQQLAAKPVRQFISLPEPMASESIGQPVENFELLTPEGQRIKQEGMGGKLRVMMFVTGFDGKAHVEQLSQLNRTLNTADQSWSVVYGDDLLRSPGSDSFELADEFRVIMEESELRLFYDQAMNASSRLKLKAVPAVVVIDANGVMQYARAMDSEQWLNHLKTAVGRIASGESVGQEMRVEYENFLDEYHQRLLAASTEAEAESNNMRHGGTAHSNAELAWEIDSLKEPGNMHIPPGSNQILVVDGWQTVVRLNWEGQIQETHQLPLPEGTAINRIRSWQDDEQRLMFVVFSLLGKNAYVFDDQWNLILEYPQRDDQFEHRGITECQLADQNQDGKAELWVSFLDERGLEKVDLVDGRPTRIASVPTRSFCVGPDAVFRVEDHALICSQPEFDLGPLKGWQITTVHCIPKEVIAFGRNESSQWKLFRIQTSDGSIRTAPIDSQLFETEIDPIAFADSGGRSVVAVSSEQRVVLHAGADDAPAEFLLGANRVGPLTGIAVAIRGRETDLLLCADNKIRMWNLARIGRGPVRAISHIDKGENAQRKIAHPGQPVLDR